MKPEYVEEMKKLGLPWDDQVEFLILLQNCAISPEVYHWIPAFLLKAANEYHALKSAVEELRDELSRLQSVVGEEDYAIIEQKLKETEGL